MESWEILGISQLPLLQAKLSFLNRPFLDRLAVQLAERIVVYELYNSGGGADQKSQGTLFGDVLIINNLFIRIMFQYNI